MSVIHNALSQSETVNRGQGKTGYNPLARHTSADRKLPIAWIASAVLVISAVLLFIIPNKTTQTESAIASVQTQDDSGVEAVKVIEPLQSVSDENVDITDIETPAELQGQPITATTSVTALASLDKTTTATPANKKNKPNDSVEAPSVKLAEQPSQPANSHSSNDPVTDKPTAVQKTNPSVKPTINNTAQTIKVPPVTTVRASSTSDETSPPDKATEDQNSIVRQSSNNWQQQVASFIEQGEIEKAEAELKSWIGAAPKDPAPRIWLAKIYINNGFFLAAEPLLSKINATEAKALLGIIYERTQRNQLAAVTFEELFRANPNQGKWLLFWAINSENSQQLAKSQTLYQNYLTLFAQQDERLSQFAQRRLQVLQGQ